MNPAAQTSALVSQEVKTEKQSCLLNVESRFKKNNNTHLCFAYQSLVGSDSSVHVGGEVSRSSDWN